MNNTDNLSEYTEDELTELIEICKKTGRPWMTRDFNPLKENTIRYGRCRET